MSIETTKEALGLLAAVQDPKQANKILKEIQDEQSKLSAARKEFAEERRECVKIRKEQVKMAEERAKLEAFAASMREQAQKLDAREQHVAQVEKELREVDEERRALDKKVAYLKRQQTKTQQMTDALETRERAHWLRAEAMRDFANAILEG